MKLHELVSITRLGQVIRIVAAQETLFHGTIRDYYTDFNDGKIAHKAVLDVHNDLCPSTIVYEIEAETA